MLVLKHSLLTREQILINVLKVLASFISMCSLHVILLLKITPRYFTQPTRDIPSIQCMMSLRGPKSIRKVDGPSLIFIYFLFHVSVAMRPHCSFLRT
jgi:hypothetical protein